MGLLRSKYDWFTPTVNNSEIGQSHTNFVISHAKMLGGSSSMNFMMYIRGNKADYDNWAARGNYGWDYDSVLPYFRKSEDLHDPVISELPYVAKYHGIDTTGIKVTRAQNFDSQYNKFLKVFEDSGFKILPEINGPEQLGFSYLDFNIFNGTRESTAQRYILPYKNRYNFKILKNSFVNRVIINNDTKVAQGVEVEVNGKVINLIAKKETIISAGAIGTPQILIKSGIGKAKDLERNNIDLVSDLPVGDNLQDHAVVPLVIKTNPGFVDPNAQAAQQFGSIQYLFNRTGPLASGLIPIVNGFITVNESQNYPDIQVSAFPFDSNNPGIDEVCQGIFYYRDDICQSLKNINLEHNLLYINVILLHPKSHGYVMLRNNTELIVNPNYMKEEEDVLTVVKGIRRLQSVLDAKSYQIDNPGLAQLNIEECNDLEFDSDEYWACFTKTMVSTGWHPVGSCSMGAVVDPELRVYGISKLRVVDASIFPTAVSGNPSAPTIMIGEKAADMIKNDHM